MAATVTVNILGDSRSGVRAADEAGRGFNRLGRNADGSDRSVRKLGKGVGLLSAGLKTLGLAVGVAAVVDFGKSVLHAASDVEQSFGAIDAVFGKSADRVKSWATSAATDVGLAKSEFAKLAAITGTMLKNTGIGDFAGQTRQLINLGADLAAQYGGTTRKAVEAIGSLLRGQVRPITEYGVSIRQADINARLHAEGLDKLTGAARRQADQQARLKLLYDQTSSAQGAFARETDTLEHKQQVFGAQLENLKATIGEKLLPVATKFLGWLSATISGTNSTSVALHKIGDVLGSFLSPIIDGSVKGWQHITKSVNDATGSSHGMHDILVKIGKAAEKYAPIVGKKLGKDIESTGKIIGEAITFLVDFWHALKAIGKWADAALGPLDELAGVVAKFGLDKLAKIASLGTLSGGLFGSGVALPGGLGRAGGVGAIGGGTGTAINLTTRPQFNLVVDVPALRSFIRMETRDEISRQVIAARGTR